MPNRVLREGIITSERVNALDWEAEVFYRRLMSVVDDYGRFTAHPSLLRAALYPLQLEKVREASVSQWLAACEAAGLVRLYTHSGASGDRSGNQSGASADRSGGEKRYLELLEFRQHVRAKESKYPQPPSTYDANAPPTNSECSADAMHVRSETESKTETETDPPNPPAGGLERLTADQNDNGQTTPTLSEERLAEGRKAGEARSYARCWVTGNCPQYLKPSMLGTFERLILAIGKEQAVERVREVMARGGVGNPFAYVETCLTTEKAAEAMEEKQEYKPVKDWKEGELPDDRKPKLTFPPKR